MRLLCALSLTFTLALVFSARADDEGAKVYKKTVPNVTWIHVKLDRGTATGSGTLIDAERRLVLTNYHVVDERTKATVYFAQLRDGQPIAERSYYTDRAKSLAINARVIVRNPKTDLAIIQLDKLPEGHKAVPLAATSAEPGQSVHAIGNAGKSGALFGYIPGKVRQVYNKDWKADLGGRIVTFHSKVVETDSATNPGDSGGPLVNDKGEIVGVTEGGAVNAQLLSTFIDVSEVKKLLAAKEVKALPGAKAVEVPMKLRDKPTTLSDGARLFKEETAKKAQDLIAEIHTKKKTDVLLETFAAAPADDLERIKKLPSAERGEYMRTWIRKRMADEKVQGVGILICNDPRSLFVEIPREHLGKYPDHFQNALARMLLEGMKAKTTDETILKLLEKIRDEAGKKE